MEIRRKRQKNKNIKRKKWYKNIFEISGGKALLNCRIILCSIRNNVSNELLQQGLNEYVFMNEFAKYFIFSKATKI